MSTSGTRGPLKGRDVRVLIVDDSAVSRLLLSELLSQAGGMEVAGAVSSGEAALRFLKRQPVDVVAMDVVMPGMDGYEATRLILENVSVPVVITSSQSNDEDRQATFKALDAGAVAFATKPRAPTVAGGKEETERFVQTIRLMSEIKVVRRRPRRARVAPAPKTAPRLNSGREIVAIGVSTGGPPVLRDILSALPRDYPVPILVAQHITAGFSESFVQWLNSSTKVTVSTAANGQSLAPGTVFVAPGGYHMRITRERRLRLVDVNGQKGASPSVSELFASVADVYGARAVGILLTGMGEDGAAELLRLRLAGAMTIAQTEETCVVFGMPRKAVELDAALHVLAPREIGAFLSTFRKTGPRV